GDSQGGIMGGTYMAVSTDVTRGLLGEPGTPYSVLLNRSVDAALYNGALAGTYGDGRAVQILWGLIQLYWDRSEPSGFVPFMTNTAAVQGCDPPDRIRVLTPAFQQTDEFLRTGTIGWFCDGICNCDGPSEEGGCATSYKSQCCDPPGGLTDPKCQ